MPGTNFNTPTDFNSNVLAALTDGNDRVMLGSFTGSTPSNANKFTKGCLLAKTDAATGVSAVYENTGTVASPSFDLVGDISPGEITLSDGDILVGAASGVAAGVTMSGDATIIADGTLTVTNSAGLGGLFVKKTALALYDFSVDGGVAGAITLASTAILPDNSVVTAVTYDVLTTCTSSSDGATIALSLPTDGALTTAIAISDGTNPWDSGVHLASVITPIAVKTTDARSIQITVATQALTAGKIVFAVDYYVSS